MSRRRNTDVAIGARVGELTIEARADAPGGRPGTWWSCRCDCGGLALRTTSALGLAIRNGSMSSCRSCLVEVRGGGLVESRARNAELFRAQWDEKGTLWTPWQSAALERRVAADLVAEFGEVLDVYEGPLSVADAWEREQEKVTQQRAAYLVWVGPLPDRAWGCHHCGKLIERALGCLICTEAVCSGCANAERHAHGADASPRAVRGDCHTLQQIADEFEISRGRAQQIETHALRKLRRLFHVAESAEETRSEVRAFKRSVSTKAIQWFGEAAA